MESNDDKTNDPVNVTNSTGDNEDSPTIIGDNSDSTRSIIPIEQYKVVKMVEDGAAADGSDSDVEIVEEKMTTIYISDTESAEESYERKVEQLLEECRLQSDIQSVKLDMEKKNKEPFAIDFKIIPIDIYQKALHYNIWSPTRILYEICKKSRWTCPKFQIEDYVPTEGFLCSVEINGRKFLSQWRSRSRNNTKSLAAAYFLQTIGFKINVDTLNSDCMHVNEFNVLKTRKELESNLLSRMSLFTKRAAVNISNKCKNNKYDRRKNTESTQIRKAQMLDKFSEDLNNCSISQLTTTKAKKLPTEFNSSRLRRRSQSLNFSTHNLTSKRPNLTNQTFNQNTSSTISNSKGSVKYQHQ